MDVFCLEGNWDARYLDEKLSLRPLLELVSSYDEIDYVHRDVATRAELDYYLERWADRRHRWFEFGYFAFHGDRGKAILLDDAEVSLGRFANMLAKYGAGENCVVHIASCYGMYVSERQVRHFLDVTGALVVCGYEEKIDMLRAAGFELLLLRELEGDWSLAEQRFKRIVNRYQSLVDDLRFVYAVAE